MLSFFCLCLIAFLQLVYGQIVVIGRGVVSAPPDIASFSVTVSTSSGSASAALTANNQAVRRQVQVLTSLGISSTNIQTQSFDVFPQFSDQPGQRQTIVGYRVANRFTVSDVAIAQLGGLLDALTRSGNTNIGFIDFGFRNPTASANAARAAAVQDAKRRARSFASAANVSLGKLLTLTEQSGSAGGSPLGLSAPGAGGSGGVGGVIIGGGSLEVVSRIEMTFAIA